MRKRKLVLAIHDRETDRTDYSFAAFKRLNSYPTDMPLRFLYPQWQVWMARSEQAILKQLRAEAQPEPPPF
jgi:hypothetical protein